MVFFKFISDKRVYSVSVTYFNQNYSPLNFLKNDDLKKKNRIPLSLSFRAVAILKKEKNDSKVHGRYSETWAQAKDK